MITYAELFTFVMMVVQIITLVVLLIDRNKKK